MSFSVRSALPVDLNSIVELRKSINGGNRYFERSERYYRWKYFENPIQTGVVKIAVAEEGKVIGLAAATIKVARRDGVDVKCAEWGDFFTHDSFRRQGVFSSLCSSIEQELLNKGIALSYIRPNDNSYPIMTNKFGFEDFGELRDVYYFPWPKSIVDKKFGELAGTILSPIVWLFALIYHRKISRSTRNETIIELTPERFNEYDWKLPEGNQNFFLKKNFTYMNWRYAQSPIPMKCFALVSEGVITGLLVIAFDKVGKAYLVDFPVENREEGKELLLYGLRYLRKQKVGTLNTLAKMESDSGDILPFLLEEFGFRKMGKPLHFVVKSHRQPQPNILWHFRLGDIDGV